MCVLDHDDWASRRTTPADARHEGLNRVLAYLLDADEPRVGFGSYFDGHFAITPLGATVKPWGPS